MTIAIQTDASGGDLSTYAGLAGAVSSWLNRNDLDSVVPNFIALAEADIFTRLALDPVLPMLEQVTGTITGEYGNAPNDLLKVLHLEIVDAGGTTWKVDRYAQANLSASQVDTAVWQQRNSLYGARVAPIQGYTLIGGQMRFFPAPQQDIPYTLTYYQKVPPLTDTNASNWLLASHPNVYLFGALSYACAYLVDEEKATAFAGAFNNALDAVLTAYPEQTDMAPMRTELAAISTRAWLA